MFLEAKRAGAAGADAAELLELCVQFPTSLLNALLSALMDGTDVGSLAQLAEELSREKEETGAGEKGILAVYRELLEFPGGVQGAVVAAMREPTLLGSSSWQQKFLRQKPVTPSNPFHFDAFIASRRRDERVGSEGRGKKPPKPSPAASHAPLSTGKSTVVEQQNREEPSRPRAAAPAEKEQRVANHLQAQATAAQQTSVNVQEASAGSCAATEKPAADTKKKQGCENTKHKEVKQRPAALASVLSAPDLNVLSGAKQNSRTTTTTTPPAKRGSDVGQGLRGAARKGAASEGAVPAGDTATTPMAAECEGRKKTVEGSTGGRDGAVLFSEMAGPGGAAAIVREQFVGFLRANAREMLGVEEGEDVAEELLEMMAEEAFAQRPTLDRQGFLAWYAPQQENHAAAAGPGPGAAVHGPGVTGLGPGAAGPGPGAAGHGGAETEGATRKRGREDGAGGAAGGGGEGGETRIQGRIHRKVECPSGRAGRYFLLMESAPGVTDVYVPRNIFIGPDIETYQKLKQGDRIEVKATRHVQGKNKWRAVTFLQRLQHSKKPKELEKSQEGDSKKPKDTQNEALRKAKEQQALLQAGFSVARKPAAVPFAPKIARKVRQQRGGAGRGEELIEARVVSDRSGSGREGVLEAAKWKVQNEAQKRKEEREGREAEGKGAANAGDAGGEGGRGEPDAHDAGRRREADGEEEEEEGEQEEGEVQGEGRDGGEQDRGSESSGDEAMRISDGEGGDDGQGGDGGAERGGEDGRQTEGEVQRGRSNDSGAAERKGGEHAAEGSRKRGEGDGGRGKEGKGREGREGREGAPRKRKREDCTFWLKGACRKGGECRFSHDKEPQTGQIVCRFLLRGDCERGAECVFSHDLKRVPCKFFHVARRCKQGAACPFAHGELSAEQREWVEREWEVNSRERREQLARAMQNERAAAARVAAGEEVHLELTQREMGHDEDLLSGPWDDADPWLAIPFNPSPSCAPASPPASTSQDSAAACRAESQAAEGASVVEPAEVPLWLQ